MNNTRISAIEYFCKNCEYRCFKKSHWEEHILTKKHKTKNVIEQKNVCFYYCKDCDVKCSHLSIYNRHIETKKHIRLTSLNKSGGEYKSSTMKSISIENGYTPDELITKIFKENQEMRNFFAEQHQELLKAMTEMVNSKAITNTNILNHNTINGNINNTRFNINVFLNEKCKNAMNFSDFLDRIEVSREDLENNARLGFVNGMSKILLDNLRKLNICERSLHCTDFKRETIYIKDDDKWTKQEDQEKLNNAIQKVSSKSMKTLLEWQGEKPEVEDNEPHVTELFSIILKNSIAGYEKETLYPKVIRKIAKEIVLDKTSLLE
jgi:hypothetical protein